MGASDVEKRVLERAEQYKAYWRDEPDTYWFYRLLEEVQELHGALHGHHDHSPALELMQIAAICLNWMGLLDERTVHASDSPDGDQPADSGIWGLLRRGDVFRQSRG